MADPLTLFGCCAALVKVCKELYKAVITTRNQYGTVKLLQKEVKMLIQTVEKMQGFEDESLSKAMEATQATHWKDVKQVLADCQTTVTKLKRLIASPNESRSVLRRTLRVGADVAKAKWNNSTIELLQKELRLHRDSLNLSMHVIQLYYFKPCILLIYSTCALRHQQQYDDLSSRVDEILCYSKHTSHVVDKVFEVENTALDSKTAERNEIVKSNVRKSAHSAEIFVRDTPIIADKLARYEATQAGSEGGFSMQKKTDVQSWLSSPLPLPVDDIDETENGAHSDSENDELPDVRARLSRQILAEGTDVENSLRDFYRIKRAREFAAREFKLTNYVEAERHLKHVKGKSDAKYGQWYAWKDETIEMLAITYSRQRKWDNAEDILKTALDEITGKERETQLLQLHHALAEMYLNKGDLRNAEISGRHAANGRIKLLGDHHVSSYQSLYLMVRISYVMKNESKLRSYTASLPKGYWTEDCEEIEDLICMDRNEAAEAASNGMLRDLLTDKFRGDMERVISTGGLTGSGGYSLIPLRSTEKQHHFDFY
jgi:Tetratricopeptide repeat